MWTQFSPPWKIFLYASLITNLITLEEWFPLQGERAHSLFLKTPILNKKSNPFLFFCSSFFLCLQGQPELCGSYHLLQSHFSFFIHLHSQIVPFGSCIILQSCSSFIFHLHGNLSCLLVTTFSSLTFLSNSFSSPHFNLLRVARHCFSWSSASDDLFFSSCSFLVLLLSYLHRVFYPQPFFPLFFSL